MDIGTWFKKRSPGFIFQRGRSLIDNYGINPKRAIQRIDSLMNHFAEFDCLPTFPVPGRVIEQHPGYIRSLQDRGAEIAVHGYNHVDLKVCNPQDAVSQLIRAVEVFNQTGLSVHGFRCPYLSCSDALLQAIPRDIFNYSSNRAIRWNLSRYKNNTIDMTVYETISRFYEAIDIRSHCSLPWVVNGMVEIPVSVPDDLQLKDGLGYDQKGLADTWISLLMRTHEHGEIFNLMFHPELASFCQTPFTSLLKTARALHPGVWIARLCDIADWWREKALLIPKLEDQTDGSISIKFPISTRARWITKGIDLPGFSPMDEMSNNLSGSTITFPHGLRPFVGIDVLAAKNLAEPIANLGFIVDQSHKARECSIYLDSAIMQKRPSESNLLSLLEKTGKPLLRLWPWPDGYRSALSITGDLDALSLMDYVNRLRV